MRKGVICLGEALIDFIPLDKENIQYQKSPGGAPANVAAGVARLGADSSFIGCLGNDGMGKFLDETLSGFGVHTENVQWSDKHKTGIVFVTNAEKGERTFEFYITPSADQFLEADELPVSLFQEKKILHFGTISMIHEKAKGATVRAITLAKEHGVIVSFDPNVRMSLWESEEKLKEAILQTLPDVDVLKLSEEELAFITNEENVDAAIEKMAVYNIPLMFVTFGSEGSIVVSGGEKRSIAAMKVKAIDTTGAGDAFVSGILYGLNEKEGNLASITLDEAADIARLASVSGGLAASVKGAMAALPTLEEVKRYL